MEIMKFEYEGVPVEFEPTRTDVMVNATQMAKIFGKQVNEFLSNDKTQAFMRACLNNGNSRYLGVEVESDLVVSKQKSGTWMHRILALKFAAWLDPYFEVWVYQVIDELLFGAAKRLHESIIESAKRRARIEELRSQLNEGDRYLELFTLENEEKRLTKRRAIDSSRQLNMFKEQFLQEKLNTSSDEYR